MKKSGTPGGNRLRALREYHGRTQLEVELDASLGIGYLQRVEAGRVVQPERDTLERILAALGAQYSERRAILEMFGYLVDAPVPTAEEIDWAINICQPELSGAVFPAYLLDCTHHLLSWNTSVPRLFDLTGAEPAGAISMLRLIFDPTYGVTGRIRNGDVFFPAQIRALRYEMQWFHDEAWYGTLLADLCQCATFEAHWLQGAAVQTHIPARPLTPLHLQLTSGETVQFRLIAEPFVQDHRFRVIYYLPADPRTIRWCLDFR